MLLNKETNQPSFTHVWSTSKDLPQFCADSGGSLEDLPGVMYDKDRDRESQYDFMMMMMMIL